MVPRPPYFVQAAGSLFGILILGLMVWLAFIPSMKSKQQAAKATLVDLERCCDACGVRYFAQAGTLLGAVREKDIIPWDDDIDVGMEVSDFAAVERELGRYGLQVYDSLPVLGSVRASKGYVKVGRRLNRLPRADEYICMIDVYLFERRSEDTLFHPQDNVSIATGDVREQCVRVPFGTVYDTKRHQRPMFVWIPQNAERYLSNEFGPRWRVRRRDVTHTELAFLGSAGLMTLCLLVALGGWWAAWWYVWRR
jgi:hypothetical protein